MPSPSVVGVGRDLGRAFRERPALVVGAGVLALIGLSLLNRDRDTGEAAEAETVDPLAGMFPGVGTWGGGGIPGSGSVPWAGYPSAGDGSYVDPGYYVDPGPIAPTPYTPPSYTPAPTPGTSTPAPAPDYYSPAPTSPVPSGGGLLLPATLDPTSPEFKSFFGIPQDIRTVGPLTYPTNITAEQRAAADAQNMSLVDWFKYQLTKVAAARQGLIIGESAEFVARTSAADYLATTLGGGIPSFYGASAGPEQRALEEAARAEAERQLGYSTAPAPVVATPPMPPPPPIVAPKPVVVVAPTTTTTPPPTAAQLEAIRKRAINAGYPNPTPQQLRDTYYRYN